ncbi:hypothetical protein HMSSN036_29620 [Paenibacillus macerans]|nr:hypothetical protein HMSSN036_29620 [Paenibacillus macerans]
MEASPFGLYYLNSIKVTLLTTALSLIISAMAAYGFSKVNFKGRDVVFMLVLATYMIPHQAILVPQFIMFRWLGLFDNHLGLVLLGASGVLGTFLLRQFFMGFITKLSNPQGSTERITGESFSGSGCRWSNLRLRLI